MIEQPAAFDFVAHDEHAARVSARALEAHPLRWLSDLTQPPARRRAARQRAFEQLKEQRRAELAADQAVGHATSMMAAVVLGLALRFE